MFRIADWTSATWQLLLIGMLFPKASNAQIGALGRGMSWPRISDVVVRGSVSIEGNAYAYSYTVHNPVRNRLPINRLEIDLRINPEEHPLGLQDLTLEHSAEDHMQLLTWAPKVSVQHVGTPAEWTVAYPGLWWVTPEDAKPMIQSGHSMGGFVVLSTEPVAVRQFVVDAVDYNFAAEPEDYDFKGSRDDLIVAVSKGIQWIGFTIAPATPPSPFTVNAWRVRMLSDASRARHLGWITTDKQLARINSLLRDMKDGNTRELEKNFATLTRFVIEEKKAGRLSDEADALLRINADYIMKQSRSTP